MKSFFVKNWHKLSFHFCMFLFAVSFLIFAIKYNTAYAGDKKIPANPPASTTYVVAVEKTIYEVWYDRSGEQWKVKQIWSR